jgi:hypothetical protein
MSYIHQHIDERLQRERADRIRLEFAAYDSPDGSLDEAIDGLEVAEQRAKMDNSILTPSASAGEKIKGIRL